MTIQESLKTDPVVLETVGHQLMSGRYRRSSKGQITDNGGLILQDAYREFQSIDPYIVRLRNEQDAERLSHVSERLKESSRLSRKVFERLEENARLSHEQLSLGLWQASSLKIIAGLGLGLALSHYATMKSSLGTYRLYVEMAFLINGRQFHDGLSGLFMHFFINDLDEQMQLFLRRSQENHNDAMEAVLNSSTVNDWLLNLGRLAPHTEAQHTVHACLAHLAKSVKAEVFEHVTGLDLARCEAAMNEFDEIAAHSYSPGFLRFTNPGGYPFSKYLQEIMIIAKHEGMRVARRRTRADVIQLHVPPVYAEAARGELDKSAGSTHE
jgi:hypothetical protein